MVDYGSLPPEINSARMYAGAGSASLTAAATTWEDLASDLRAQALSYSSITSGLSAGQWRGAASTSMATAAASYVEWMNTTAAQAEQTASQAKAAVAAYEAAFALTVAPTVIAANRTQLATLVATNVLGQNTPAIAANEAEYAEMWAQDSAAMYSYAGASAMATQLIPFTEPHQNTTSSGLVSQAQAVIQASSSSTGSSTQSTLSQVVNAVPATLQGLASPSSSAASSTTTESSVASSSTSSSSSSSLLSELWDDWGPDANIWNTIFSSGFFMPGNYLGTAADFMGQSQQAAGGTSAAASDGLAGGTASTLTGVVGWSAPIGVGNEVSAALGRAASIGPLSVPPSVIEARTTTPIASALTAGPGSTQPALAAGMPGMPGMPVASPPATSVTSTPPKYGFRSTVVARPPSAG